MSKLSTIVLFLFSVAGCGPELEPGPPPPTAPEPLWEPECPWNYTCAELVEIDECPDWAVACGDRFRCVDTEAESVAGLVCKHPDAGESSSSSESGGESSRSSESGEECAPELIGQCEDGCANCFPLECDNCTVDANDITWCFAC